MREGAWRLWRTLLALAWAIVSLLAVGAGLMLGLSHALARHYAPGQTPDAPFMVLVRSASDPRPRAVFWNRLTPDMQPVTQPMTLPADVHGSGFARLKAVGPDTWELFVDLDTAQLHQRYRVVNGQIHPLYVRSHNIVLGGLAWMLAFPVWGLCRWGWRRWRRGRSGAPLSCGRECRHE
ncbi:hypothetical protein EII20_04195 [Comamonadaceae bacterium OH2545_COT-014]|nr:hypothetical protein EII20_04195 [Comamonadaceae bacterium OH2545_COT-014]